MLRDHCLPHCLLLALKAGNFRRNVIAAHAGHGQANQNHTDDIVCASFFLLLRRNRVGRGKPEGFLGKLPATPRLIADLANIGRRNAFRAFGASTKCGRNGDRNNDQCSVHDIPQFG